jgi:protease PrsW
MAGVIAPIVAGALVITLTIGINIGPVAFGIGLAVALLPVPFLVACFLWLDRYEPEPWKYLAFCFGWGSCVATSVALGVNTLGSYLFESAGMSGNADAVLVAPFIEETMKALGPVLLLIFLRRRRRQPISVVDGIVYFGLSATGFAMAENILYLGGIYVTGSETGGALTGAVMVAALAAVRIGISGFAHPLFTSMTGIGFGLAASGTDRRVRWLAPLAGWIGAMCLHSGWNLMSSLGSQAVLTGYLVVMAPIFFAAVGVALWARGHEGRQVARMLQPYVRTGWLSPPELGALSTMNRRMAARRWAKRVAGPAGVRAMEAYQFALTTLALARGAEIRGSGIRGSGPAGDFPARESALLTEMSGYRQAFTGRDPAMPPVLWDGANYHVRFPDGSVRVLPPPQQPVVPLPVRAAPVGYGWRI